MEGGDPLATLISGLRALKLTAVEFSQCVAFADLIGGRTARCLMVSYAIGERLISLNCYHSRGSYSVCLGLHPYLPDGSRSGLETEMEFHEGAILLSTLLALYRYAWAFSLLSVWCFLYFIALSFV